MYNCCNVMIWWWSSSSHHLLKLVVRKAMKKYIAIKALNNTCTGKVSKQTRQLDYIGIMLTYFFCTYRQFNGQIRSIQNDNFTQEIVFVGFVMLLLIILMLRWSCLHLLKNTTTLLLLLLGVPTLASATKKSQHCGGGSDDEDDEENLSFFVMSRKI